MAQDEADADGQQPTDAVGPLLGVAVVANQFHALVIYEGQLSLPENLTQSGIANSHDYTGNGNYEDGLTDVEEANHFGGERRVQLERGAH